MTATTKQQAQLNFYVSRSHRILAGTTGLLNNWDGSRSFLRLGAAVLGVKDDWDGSRRSFLRLGAAISGVKGLNCRLQVTPLLRIK